MLELIKVFFIEPFVRKLERIRGNRNRKIEVGVPVGNFKKWVNKNSWRK